MAAQTNTRQGMTRTINLFGVQLPEIMIHVVLLGLGFLYVYPFIWMVGSSLKSPAGFFTQGINALPDIEPQWQNFERAWVQANFGLYLQNTVMIAVATTFFSLLFSSITAYTLARLRIPGKSIVVGLIGITFLLPRGYTILPIFEIVQKLGLLDTIWSVVLVLTTGNMLFATFLFYGFMRTIPLELEEAAIIDGASVWQRYLYVIAPLAKPMFGTVGLFIFVGAWNEFFLALVFTLGNPDLRTLAVGMYSFVGTNSRDWTLICAAATISLIPIITVFVILQRYFVEAFAGAVKS